MRKNLLSAVVIMVVAVLAMSGCATEKFVNEQVQAAEQRSNAKIGEVQNSVEGNQGEISKLHKQDDMFKKQIADLSATAKDALNRATEAGKLAEGKFLFEVTLTDEKVNFGTNKYDLSDDAKAELDAFASKIKGANQSVYVEVQGHTDATGSEKFNLELGYKRAEQVMRYLNADQGFALHRMNVISYGEYKPIADNKTREGRAQNRRVTLVVLN